MQPIRSLFKSISKFFPRDTRTETADSVVLRESFGGESAPPYYSSLFNIYKTNSWIHSSTNLIVNSCTVVPIRLRDRVSKKVLSPIEAIPIGAVLKYPNPYMTQIDLMEMLYLHLQIVGNAFWELVIKENKLVGIYPLDPLSMEIVPDSQKYIKEYIYTAGSNSIRFLPEQIIHFKFSDPQNEFWGQAPVAVTIRQARLESKMKDFGEKFFDNDATPGGVLSTDRLLSDPTYHRLKKRWEDRHKGVSKKFKTAILEDGMKYSRISAPLNEVDFSDIKTNIRDEILVAGGVPPTLLGVPGISNYASARVAQSIFYDSHIAPILRKIAAIMDKDIMNRFASQYEVVFDTSVAPVNIIKLSANSRVVSRLYKEDLMTKNEARAFVGLPPINTADGDRFKSEKSSGSEEANAASGEVELTGETETTGQQGN